MQEENTTLTTKHVLEMIYSEMNARCNALIGAALYLEDRRSNLTITDIIEVLGETRKRVYDVLFECGGLLPFTVDPKGYIRWQPGRIDKRGLFVRWQNEGEE